MELITEYLLEEALILIPVLLILGKAIKMSRSIADWLIVWILLVSGVGFAVWLMGPDVNSVIQGILVAGAATYVHQIFKQTNEKS